MLPKIVGPFFYFCYPIETEGIKAKLPKSGRNSLVTYLILFTICKASPNLWYRGWDSNPQKLVPKTSAYANSATAARLRDTTALSIPQ